MECASIESWTKTRVAALDSSDRQMVSTHQPISQLGNGKGIDSFTKCHQTEYMKEEKEPWICPLILDPGYCMVYKIGYPCHQQFRVSS